MGEIKIKKKYIYIIGIALVLTFVTYYFLLPYITGNAVGPGSGDSNGGVSKNAQLAQCLTDNGAVMYGTKTCSHCNNQKDMFGDAFKYVNYVECTEQIQLCRDKGISSVPVWEIGGQFYLGERSLESLATIAGCPFE